MLFRPGKKPKRTLNVCDLWARRLLDVMSRGGLPTIARRRRSDLLTGCGHQGTRWRTNGSKVGHLICWRRFSLQTGKKHDGHDYPSDLCSGSDCWQSANLAAQQEM